eukprot:Opistho-1_new@3708
MSGRRSSGRLKGPVVQRSFTERLGPKWQRPEIHTFFEGYLKYGKNWEKIAGMLKDRTADMVEALFHHNKTFMSNEDATANSLCSVMQDMYDKQDEAAPPPARSPAKAASSPARAAASPRSSAKSPSTPRPAPQSARGKKTPPGSGRSGQAAVPSVFITPQEREAAKALVSVRSSSKRARELFRNDANGDDELDSSPPSRAAAAALAAVAAGGEGGSDDVGNALPPKKRARVNDSPYSAAAALSAAETHVSQVTTHAVVSSPKCSLWIACEWFYSTVDHALFRLGDNYFVEYLNQFKLGKVEKMTRNEWNTVRHHIGKPRRFSRAFLAEERRKLAEQREIVRSLQRGESFGDVDPSVLPREVPNSLVLNQRVTTLSYLRERRYLGEMFLDKATKRAVLRSGRILAVNTANATYRVQYDNGETADVLDVFVMAHDPVETVPSAAVLRKRGIGGGSVPQFSRTPRPILPAPVPFASGTPRSKHGAAHQTPNSMAQALFQAGQPVHPTYSTSRPARKVIEQAIRTDGTTGSPLKTPGATAERAGIAVRRSEPNQAYSQDDLRLLARLSKILGIKRLLVEQLKALNREAEHAISMRGADSLSPGFQQHYAWVVVQLDEVNRALKPTLLGLRPQPKAEIVSKDSSSHNAHASLHTILAETSVSRVASECTHLARSYVNEARAKIAAERATNNKGKGRTADSAETKESSRLHDLISHCVALVLQIKACAEPRDGEEFTAAEMSSLLDHALSKLRPVSAVNASVFNEIEQAVEFVKGHVMPMETDGYD